MVLGGVSPRRRSLWAVAALGAGYLAARTWQDSASDGGWPAVPMATAWFAVCCGVLIAALLTQGRRCRVLLWIAVAILAGGWYTTRLGPGPPERIDVLLAPALELPGPAIASIHGVATELPQRIEPRVGLLGSFARMPSIWVFELRTTTVEINHGRMPTTGTVRVAIPADAAGETPNIEPGDILRVTGEFRLFDPPANPGQPNRAMLALQDGVVGRIFTSSEALIEHAGDSLSAPSAFHKFITWARLRAARALDLRSDVSNAQDNMGRALLAAMLLGAREHGLDDVDAAFRRVGLVHLVAISGFNLSLLALAASFALRVTGERGRLESLGVAALIAFYLLIVPAESPVLRAGIAVLVFLLTDAMGRRYDRLTLLGWVAFALLLWRPLDFWSLGFQLSFGIVAVLLWQGRRVHDRMFGVPLRGVVSVNVPIGEHPGLVLKCSRKAVRWGREKVTRAVSASLLAWGAAAPVILVHTGVVSPWAPLTGLIALPFAGATLIIGYLALVIGFVWPAAGAFVGHGAVWSAELLASMVLVFDRVPAASVSSPRISSLWGLVAVGVVLFWFARGRWRSAWAWAMTAVVAVWFVGETRINTSLRSDATLRVDTFAVGDGTCHLIRAGDDALLWDCGSSQAGLGLRELPRAVRAVGGWRVRTALVTHANLDHFLCLPDMVEPLGIQELLVTRALLDAAASKPESASAAMLREMKRQGVSVREIAAGASLPLGAATCEFLAPVASVAYADANDSSIVGRVTIPTTAGDRVVLMTGDIGPFTIGDLQRRFPALRADILELPHHGSAKPEAIAMVADLDPHVVMQSTGPQRLHDSRWAPVQHGRTWGVTARDGALWLEVTRDGSIRSGTTRHSLPR